MDFNVELGVCKTDAFSKVYPVINHHILNNEKWQPCRDGNVKELLNFKTIITNPYQRCVGGYRRGINIFFLLAEAMWIFTGRKDVKFLTHFNKRMADFSDDGKVFHAPYGFRLRHWGVRSEDRFTAENLHAAQGCDQVKDAIRILEANPNSRQVVMSIWNPDLDLGTKTKDIPCNDMVMLKIRDGKLITTIQNRSNDLHWGLPTNLFQFSFLTEMLSACLGIELGTQTHNSQSLHIYDWNKIAEVMDDTLMDEQDDGDCELYSLGAKFRKMEFNFKHSVAVNRLREIDYHLNLVIDNLSNIADGGYENVEEVKQITDFSNDLAVIYKYLATYLAYKQDISGGRKSNDSAIDAKETILAINQLHNIPCMWDVSLLAQNWFCSRIENNKHAYLGKL